FNPGKIVDTPPMDTGLRFAAGQDTPEIATLLDFSENQGYIRSAELCNGSGDCRKSELSGGTMCPSYMATRNEKDTTRARANILREMLTKADGALSFSHPQIREVMDLCLSCKGCKSECPSNVDMAKLKAEWNYQSYKAKGVPLRTRMIGHFTLAMKLASKMPWAYRFVFDHRLTASVAKRIAGFATQRSMPDISSVTLTRWIKKQFRPTTTNEDRSIYFFVDEFTNFNDGEIGKKALLLLDKLGYDIRFVPHAESGRTYLSKGLLDQALDVCRKNVNLFYPIVSEQVPLVGIEPSTILTFRDEYIDMLRGEEKEMARKVAKNTLTIEEFLAREMDKGNISSSQFVTTPRKIKVHGHCHQKALSSLTPTKKILKLPANYDVQMIPSGCCGMAGSFGYEKEHFDVSMQIGELVLFPTIRQQSEDVLIAAAGTSCRHQIKDGTGRRALHPVEILVEALA
ncbi:MAG: 4Fe-4S dicluster domain-containing protein, partial [Cyclobacteriaceae bacterium]|nr:4Fe-4S dicluster domain-containing protein [Cyclobacteriaceae bacterium]